MFCRYLEARGLADLKDLRPKHVDAFVSGQPLRPCNRARGYEHLFSRWSRQIRGARHLMRYLREAGIVPPEAHQPRPIFAPALDEWLTYLSRHRGLTQKSLSLYGRHIARFLRGLGPVGTIAGLR